MDKQMFLDRLRIALSGNVSARLVEENVRYYEEYINSQIRQGYSETEVLTLLGEPRLLAKSIIMANNGEFSDTKTSRDNDIYNTEREMEQRNKNEVKVVNMPKWVTLIIVLAIIVIIFNVITSLVSALLPIAIPILFIYFLVKLFRDWLN